MADFRKANEPAQKITEVPKADGFASLHQTEETVAKVAATKAEATATQLAKFDAIDQKFGAASPFQHSATYNATADFYKQQRTDRAVDLTRQAPPPSTNFFSNDGLAKVAKGHQDLYEQTNKVKSGNGARRNRCNYN